MYTHSLDVQRAGRPLADARRALVLLHGRGATAESILTLTGALALPDDYAVLAPQATHRSWYPHSFLAPPPQNEPALASALEVIDQVVNEVLEAGVGADQLFLAGFSQGACLTLEYGARHARRYGGLIAFTGGLIGDRLYPERYSGGFGDTPIFIGSSDVDAHVPADRVAESTAHLRQMGATVTERLYPGMAHTINDDELAFARQMLA